MLFEGGAASAVFPMCLLNLGAKLAQLLLEWCQQRVQLFVMLVRENLAPGFKDFMGQMFELLFQRLLVIIVHRQSLLVLSLLFFKAGFQLLDALIALTAPCPLVLQLTVQFLKVSTPLSLVFALTDQHGFKAPGFNLVLIDLIRQAQGLLMQQALACVKLLLKGCLLSGQLFLKRIFLLAEQINLHLPGIQLLLHLPDQASVCIPTGKPRHGKRKQGRRYGDGGRCHRVLSENNSENYSTGWARRKFRSIAKNLAINLTYRIYSWKKGCSSRGTNPLKRSGPSVAIRQMHPAWVSATGWCVISGSMSATSPRQKRPSSSL